MKAKLIFTLPEEKDEHHLAVHGVDYYCSLWDLDQYLRSEYKHNDKLSGEQTELIETIRNKLRECMDYYNVSFEDVE